MSALEFPTQDEINRIYGTAPLKPFRDMNERIFTLLDKGMANSSSDLGWFKNIEATEPLMQLHYKLMDIAKSYILLSYFFEKGIPDEEWYISPGKKGESIEYFPHFEPIHFEVKDWFDYFSDTFYHKLFSAFDMVGHLLNVQYELGLKQKKVSFASVLDKLRADNIHKYQALQDIRDNPIFCKANKLRNDITHNYLPSSTGLSVTREQGKGWKGIKLGFREYTPSAVIMSNVQGTVGLLERVVTLVTE